MSGAGKITLNDGKTLDALGFGTWQSKPGEVGAAVEAALKAGVRHLDLAKVYGNQPEIGEAIKKSGVPRSEMFITSKLWNTQHKPELVEAALDDTLKELQLDYLDLYLIHWPVAFDSANPHKELFPIDDEKVNGKKSVKLDKQTSLVDTWKAMIALKKTGKTKSIGVSNFDTKMVDAIIEATGEVPVCNQIERHCLLPGTELVQHHKQKNILIVAYSPLANNSCGDPKLFEYDEVKEIAQKKGCDPAQVVISWGLVGGHSVIPKSVSEKRIKTNAVAVDLTKDEIAQLDALVKKHGEKRYNVAYTYDPIWDINVFNDPSEKPASNQVKIQ